MPFLSQPRRRRRSGEWTSDRAVTFIVTLAATHFVTLAARRAGMSRKAAYALKARDPVFSAAWIAAAEEGARAAVQGYKVEEVHEPPISSSQGDKAAFGNRFRSEFRFRHAGLDPAPAFFSTA